MIKRFKKGADKISVAALVLAIGICFTTVTDAVDNGNSTATPINTASQGSNNKLKFKIESKDYTFISLQRAMDFIDPQFKVPSYMPDGNELFQFELFKKRIDSQDMLYENTINRNQQSPDQTGYTFLASKGNILKYIEEDSGVKSTNSKKTMKLSFVNGTSMTNIAKFDKDSWQGADASTAPAQITVKNFIWSDNGIWYCIQYYYEMIDNNKKKQVSQNISVNELTKIVSSLKYPKDIKNRDTFSTNKLPFYIYDEKDFEAAKKQLSYSVKFPISIDERVKLVNARRFENSVFYMQYNPIDLKAEDGVGTIQFYQCSEKSNFKDLGNGYIELNKAGSFGMRKMEAQKIKFGGTDVFVIPAPKDGYTGTFYVWVQNGICYQVLMSPKNSTELLKPFMDAKTY